MNAFEELCKLASEENWCWKLSCSTCGHMHFRYAFFEIANGASPLDEDWSIHSGQKIPHRLIYLPNAYTDEQKESILEICAQSSIKTIAASCRFPDWLGYMGLVLSHMGGSSSGFLTLSSCWAQQLMDLAPESKKCRYALEDIAAGDGYLGINELEICEHYMFRPTNTHHLSE